MWRTFVVSYVFILGFRLEPVHRQVDDTLNPFYWREGSGIHERSRHNKHCDNFRL